MSRREIVRDRSARAPFDRQDAVVALGAVAVVAGVAMVSFGAALVLTGVLVIGVVVVLTE